MKKENDILARHFIHKDNIFYTDCIINKMNGDIIKNYTNKEFIVYFCDNTIYTSLDFKIVVNENKDFIQVNFIREDIQLNVKYTAREDVISKEIEILFSDKEINYIDVDIFEFNDQSYIYYPKKQDNIKEMANFSGYYVELGQPIYAKSLFLGMEFPMGENRIKDASYFSRYYFGENVKEKKVLWPTIIGTSKDYSKGSVQKAFFDYIENIAQPSYFRKQYNSWYDHMTKIDEKIILKSFSEIYKGFSNHDIKLDAFVVDDGWCDYKSVWDFNEKFPNELKEIKNLVSELGASLGLWIGPRGGYGGTEVIMSDWLQENPTFGSKNLLSNDVNVGDFNYLNIMKEKMLNYQRKYDISYWKIDGWLLKPDKPDCSGDYAMHTMTKVYEFLLKLLEDIRKDRGDKDCWLNLTSYVNPSPWFLKYVNSLWIQVSQDVGFEENSGNDINRMITYRDIQYIEFLEKRDIQLPLWALYNHDPIYASTAHTWYLDQQMYATHKDFEDYLMFISTRGNAFWEFHYSYSMFDEKRWEANARAIKWIEENYYILKYSKKVGGNPKLGEIYGYHCTNQVENKEILSLRNPSDTKKSFSDMEIDFSNYTIVRGDGTILSDREVDIEPYSIIILRK